MTADHILEFPLRARQHLVVAHDRNFEGMSCAGPARAIAGMNSIHPPVLLPVASIGSLLYSKFLNCEI